MITSLYTETLANFLERNESSSQWQAIKTRFDMMPKFEVVENNFDLDFYELFKEKYDVREIGAETESLFTHYINETLSKILLKYRDKIQLYIDNFNDLMQRKIEVESEGENDAYLNPINTNSTKLTDKTTFKGKKEHVFGFWHSNARIMKEIIGIEDLFNSALDEFEPCFMGVL